MCDDERSFELSGSITHGTRQIFPQSADFDIPTALAQSGEESEDRSRPSSTEVIARMVTRQHAGAKMHLDTLILKKLYARSVEGYRSFIEQQRNRRLSGMWCE